MNPSPTTPDFVRIPRLPRMRSQRIVHIVQAEDGNDVSVVTVTEDGRIEETLQTVDFCVTGAENKDGPKTLVDVDEGLDEGTTGDPIVFEIDLDDGHVQQLTPCGCDEYNPATRSRKTSLFSNDEFEPIRMKLPKRTPRPLRLTNHKVVTPEADDPSSQTPASPPHSVASDDSSHSTLDSPSINIGNSQTLYAQNDGPYMSASSTTLVSVESAASSATCVDHVIHPKYLERTFCAYEKDGISPKPVDVTTPYSVTGTRGLVDLRTYGYNFGWSRLTGRSDVAHGLRPEDAAELEVFLSRGPNAFPAPVRPKLAPGKNSFEKRFLDMLKILK